MYAKSMRSFQLDPVCYVPLVEDRVKDLCWTAREVLATFMEEGVDFEDQAFHDLAEMSCRPTQTELTIHNTPHIRINLDQIASLTNMPYICDAEGSLLPWTGPGYTALHIEAEDFDDNALPADGLEQLIFRIPTTDEEAAIFDGFAMEEENQIKESEHGKLDQVACLLEFVRGSLRQHVELIPGYYEELYHSRVPRSSLGAILQTEL
jgi:hypothetical protein